jgi:hypothetical protein
MVIYPSLCLDRIFKCIDYIDHDNAGISEVLIAAFRV